MNNLKHARKGQMVVSEYVLLFFVVVAGVSAMALFVQRGLQSRSRDAKIYMVDLAAKACEQATQVNGVDCLGATGVNTEQTNKLAYEYEPYYGLSSSKVRNDSADKKTLDESSTWGKDFATSTKINSQSAQKPPKYGDLSVFHN